MKSTSTRIRQITDGAIITALYCVFMLISRLTGLSLEYELFFVMPLPVALYAYKYDFKTAWIPGIATTILSVFIAINPLNAAVYVLPAIIVGIVYGGFLVKKKVKPVICILSITIINLISEILSAVILSKILGIPDIFEEMNEIITWVSNAVDKMNINNFNMSLFKAMVEGIIPSVLLLVSLLDALMVYLLFNLIILKSKLFEKKDDTISFQIIRAPKWLSIVYLVSVPLTFFVINYFDVENQILHFLIVFEVNLHIMLTMVYIYFGLKTSAIYCRIKQKMGLILIVYLFIFLFPLTYIIAFIGTADSFYNISQKLIENNRA